MIKIYTDGSCKGNPGPGGWAAIIFSNGQMIKELSGGMRTQRITKWKLLQ